MNMTPTVRIVLGSVLLCASACGSETPTENFSPVSVREGDPPTAFRNQAYEFRATATGGDGGYTWSLASGELPEGLTLSANGFVSGTPTTLGVFSFSVRVSSSDGQSASGSYSITVELPAPLVDVWVGSSQACGVTDSGEAYCWWAGNQPELVSPSLRFESLTVGSGWACGVAIGGEAYCWGDNTDGQFGDGTNASTSIPQAVSGGLSFASLSANINVGFSGKFTCGVTTGGDAYCWGGNESGQLGDGSTLASNEPVPVSGGYVFNQVSTGSRHACGLVNDGTIYCWGSGTAMGGTDSATPIALGGGVNLAFIEAGMEHQCGITTLPGEGYCWGSGLFGKLGDGGEARSPTPTRVFLAGSFTDIAAGTQHSCGLLEGGSAYCWGGILDNSFHPTVVPGGMVFTALDSGGLTCAVTGEGEAYCWGGTYGNTGPVLVPDP